MNRNIVVLLLTVFIVTCFTGHSWAFGSRHHSGSSQGTSSSTGNSGGGSNSSGPFQPGNNPVGQSPSSDGSGLGSVSPAGNGGANPNSGPTPNAGFPAAPVPEPMTMSLLGLGFAGFLMKRRNKQI